MAQKGKKRGNSQIVAIGTDHQTVIIDIAWVGRAVTAVDVECFDLAVGRSYETCAESIREVGPRNCAAVIDCDGISCEAAGNVEARDFPVDIAHESMLIQICIQVGTDDRSPIIDGGWRYLSAARDFNGNIESVLCLGGGLPAWPGLRSRKLRRPGSYEWWIATFEKSSSYRARGSRPCLSLKHFLDGAPTLLL